MECDEMIEVIQAYKNGQKIQKMAKHMCKDKDWVDVDNPSWNFQDYFYKVKPTPKYRPYKDFDEFIQDWTNIKTQWHKVSHPLGGVWLKSISENDTDTIYMIAGMANVAGTPHIYMHDFWISLEDAFNTFTYIDGTPFGIKD